MRPQKNQFWIALGTLLLALLMTPQTALAGAREEAFKKHREMIQVLKKWDISSNRVSLGLKSSQDRAYFKKLNSSKAFQRATALPFLDVLVIREGRRKITLKKVQSRPLKVAVNNRTIAIDPKNILQSIQRSKNARSAWQELILPSAVAAGATPVEDPKDKWVFLYAMLSNYNCSDCQTPDKETFAQLVPEVLQGLQIKKMTCGKDETRIALNNDTDFTFVCRHDRCSIPNADEIVDDVITAKKNLAKQIMEDLNDSGVPITGGVNMDRATEGIFSLEPEVYNKLTPEQQTVVKNYNMEDNDKLYILRTMIANDEMAQTVTTTLEPYGAVIHSFNECCEDVACRQELSSKGHIQIETGEVSR